MSAADPSRGRRARSRPSGIRAPCECHDRPPRGSTVSTAPRSASTKPRAAVRGSHDGEPCASTAARSRSRSRRVPQARTTPRALRRWGAGRCEVRPRRRSQACAPPNPGAARTARPQGARHQRLRRAPHSGRTACRCPRSSRTTRAESGRPRRGGTHPSAAASSCPTRRCCRAARHAPPCCRIRP